MHGKYSPFCSRFNEEEDLLKQAEVKHFYKFQRSAELYKSKLKLAVKRIRELRKGLNTHDKQTKSNIELEIHKIRYSTINKIPKMEESLIHADQVLRGIYESGYFDKKTVLKLSKQLEKLTDYMKTVRETVYDLTKDVNRPGQYGY